MDFVNQLNKEIEQYQKLIVDLTTKRNKLIDVIVSGEHSKTKKSVLTREKETQKLKIPGDLDDNDSIYPRMREKLKELKNNVSEISDIRKREQELIDHGIPPAAAREQTKRELYPSALDKTVKTNLEDDITSMFRTHSIIDKLNIENGDHYSADDILEETEICDL